MSPHEERFLDAAKTTGGNGVSPREMTKKNPDRTLIQWMRTGGRLYDRGLVKHAWSPVKGDAGCVQESRYTFVNPGF